MVDMSLPAQESFEDSLPNTFEELTELGKDDLHFIISQIAKTDNGLQQFLKTFDDQPSYESKCDLILDELDSDEPMAWRNLQLRLTVAYLIMGHDLPTFNKLKRGIRQMVLDEYIDWETFHQMNLWGIFK